MATIEFKDDLEVELTTTENNDHRSNFEVIKKGSKFFCVDILDRNKSENTVDIKFGNGECCYGLSLHDVLVSEVEHTDRF